MFNNPVFPILSSNEHSMHCCISLITYISHSKCQIIKGFIDIFWSFRNEPFHLQSAPGISFSISFSALFRYDPTVFEKESSSPAINTNDAVDRLIANPIKTFCRKSISNLFKAKLFFQTRINKRLAFWREVGFPAQATPTSCGV